MDRLDLVATEKTPAVRFDPQAGELMVKGCSVHENADRFYRPVYQAVERYSARPARKTHVVLELSYFNSSTAKYILDILKRLDELHATGASDVSMEWRYEADDLDMQEAGTDYRDLLDLPVKLVALKV